MHVTERTIDNGRHLENSFISSCSYILYKANVNKIKVFIIFHAAETRMSCCDNFLISAESVPESSHPRRAAFSM